MQEDWRAHAVYSEDADEWDDQVQHLEPKEIASTGDDEWHTIEVPVKVSDDTPSEMFVVFKTNETGDTGVMIGNVSWLNSSE